ncbi:hypothetical protein BX600DRAFT_534087 [Xylariales sp. PMI_506]|nr:hypothetical protein BX600DRAFT_534087 [Xylariales sp. PMI_506]
MAAISSFTNARVVVLGGTGAQGHSVVRALAKGNSFQVSVLTRDTTSPASRALLAEFPSIKLLQGSYTTEEGLRTALANQDVVYLNIDSFSIGEPFEYFWTFRAYEIAVQSKVRRFLYSGTSPIDKFVAHGLAEEYRNSHNVVSARLTGWLTAQPLDTLPWSIITGGVYAEMLNLLLLPVPIGDGYVFKLPVDKDSVMPLIPLENYGEAVKWALENPEKSLGKFVSAGPFHMTFGQVAESLERYTGKPSGFQPVTIDEWMQGVSRIVDPESRLPRGSSLDDPTTFSFRKSFGAWWSIWRDNRVPGPSDASLWADIPLLSKYKTLEDWMTAVNYDPSYLSTSFKGK